MFTSAPPNVQATLLGIVGLLAVCTAVIILLNRLLPGPQWTEVNRRCRTWWIIVGTFCAAMAFGPSVSLAFFALISFAALREFLTLTAPYPFDRHFLLLAYGTVPVQYACILAGRLDLFMMFMPLTGLLLLSPGLVFANGPQGYLRAAGSLNWGLMVTVFALGHLGCLFMLPAAGNPVGGGAGLLIYLVFLAQFSDVVQYVAGKLFGRRRVVPRLSPGKTWEGLIAGLVVVTVLGALLAPWLTPLDTWQGFAAGLLIGISGFIGDITLSAVKREHGVKDMGALLPGHGGVLDRTDSLIFAAPLFFHFVYQLHY
jgi:phosphatidate cytidylyltransferase